MVTIVLPEWLVWTLVAMTTINISLQIATYVLKRQARALDERLKDSIDELVDLKHDGKIDVIVKSKKAKA